MALQNYLFQEKNAAQKCSEPTIPANEIMRLVLTWKSPRLTILFDRVNKGLGLLLAWLLYLPYLALHYLFHRHLRKLHVGCGRVKLSGWINADLSPRAELVIDLRWPLPFPTDYLDYIYSEHVLEHLRYKTAVRFLREARRVLAHGGVIRIAMPDLDDLVEGYQNDWRRFDWVSWPEHSFIKTRAQMINIAFRWWGHQHLYNREELERALRDAGFSDIRFVEPGESTHPDLRNLETRADSRLVAEATKA